MARDRDANDVAAGAANRLVYSPADCTTANCVKGMVRRLTTAISIVLTDDVREVSAGHLRSVLCDQAHAVAFGDQLQLHVVELPKYNSEDESIGQAEKLEQWVFFLDRADAYDAESLQRLLPDSAFQKATGVLEMISRSPELRLLYDDRTKAELDQFSALKEARAEGEARGERAERKAKREANWSGVSGCYNSSWATPRRTQQRYRATICRSWRNWLRTSSGV